MDQNQFEELEAILDRFDARLAKLEEKIFQTSSPRQERVELPPVTQTPKKVKLVRAIEGESSSNLLGIVGVGCFILAMVLLIKFSVDSGWLNPTRQIFIAGLLGV